MAHFVLGTAGHIDHGKTSLVKILSGMETDSLKEEKERGISIDLGFASMQLPSGATLSIIDVPGHERFIKNMIAGAAGIDMVLLVVAADDGIMPQTREHMDICRLLGVRQGLVAVTKADMVDDEWLSMTIDDIKTFLRGSFLDGAPVVPVSSITGRGIGELISAMNSIVRKVKRRTPDGIFRMPVDRAFIKKGFGTVVSGTALSGRVAVGDEVEILPEGITAKVRGIQTHWKTIQEGVAGSRVAINLQGIEREEVKRGDTIVTPRSLKPSNKAEVLLSLLPSASRSIKDGINLLLHFATSSVTASPVLLGTKEIKPGGNGLARLKLGGPAVAVHGDRFVLRFSEAGTIGGGIFLDMDPPKRSSKTAVDELKILASDDLKEKILLCINRAGNIGIKSAELQLKLSSSALAINNLISQLTSSNYIYKIGDAFVSAAAISKVKDRMISELDSYHRKEPMKEGMPREEMRTRLNLPHMLLALAIDELIKGRRIAAGKESIRLFSHMASGGEKKEEIISIYMKAGLTPPTLTELMDEVNIKEREALDLLNLLYKEKQLIKVKDLFFFSKTVDTIIEEVRGFFSNKTEMLPADFKDMTGLSRKFAIPLLEYLDSQKITIRVGDSRRLRKG